jgi:sulfatase maturation enzyme AslB (radical SAM superfamily)
MIVIKKDNYILNFNKYYHFYYEKNKINFIQIIRKIDSSALAFNFDNEEIAKKVFEEILEIINDYSKYGIRQVLLIDIDKILEDFNNKI